MPCLRWTSFGIVAAHGTGLSLLDPETGRSLQKITTSAYAIAAISAQAIAAIGVGRRTEVFDLRTGEQIHTLRSVVDVRALSPDGRFLLNGENLLHDLQRGTSTKIPAKKYECLHLLASGQTCVCVREAKLALIDASPGASLNPLFAVGSDRHTSCVADDDSIIVVLTNLGDGSVVEVFDLVTRTKRWQKRVPGLRRDVVAAGDRVAVATDEKVTVFDSATGKQVFVEKVWGVNVSLSPDGGGLVYKSTKELVAVDLERKTRSWSLPIQMS